MCIRDRDIGRVSDARLWEFRTAASKSLVGYARGRLSLDLAAGGVLPAEVEAARHLFDPNALTLGFARRFATYKRPNLLLHDSQRLLRLLTNSQRPVQLKMCIRDRTNRAAGLHRHLGIFEQPRLRESNDLSSSRAAMIPPANDC